jgi:hypothetical protein
MIRLLGCTPERRRALDVTSVFVATGTREAATSLEDERGWRGHVNSDDPA